MSGGASGSGVHLVNASILHHLFMQVVFKASQDSLPAPGEPIDQDAAFYRIEQLGFQIGRRLIERIILQTSSSTGQTINLTEQIECFKFLCKEFWIAIFGKSIDNLKTNHRGIYVLQDQSFSWIARFAVDAQSTQTAKMAVLV
jgi:hypothetical protein